MRQKPKGELWWTH